MHSSYYTPVAIALKVVPMISGLASLISSTTINIMIFRSSKKLADPYRRLIFGISCFDILQSLSHTLVLFKSNPDEAVSSWLTLGNQASCQVLGFFYIAGHNGSLFYNLSLNIFYLCLVKYNVKRDCYRYRVEPFLHGLPVAWSIISSSIIIGKGQMNPSIENQMCFIAPYPDNCLDSPDVECIRGTQTYLYRAIFHVGPVFVAFVGILLTLGILWWTVSAQERRMHKYSMASYVSNIRSNAALQRPSISIPNGSGPALAATEKENSKQKIGQRLFTRLQSRDGSFRRSLGRRRRGRGFLTQAMWYTLAFLLTHIFSVIYLSMRMAGSKPNFTLLVLVLVFNPLQGMLNILVFTRPHVAKERTKNSSLSWWGAFKKVVASGGDDDDERTNRLRRGIAMRAEASARSAAASARRRTSGVQGARPACRFSKRRCSSGMGNRQKTSEQLPS